MARTSAHGKQRTRRGRPLPPQRQPIEGSVVYSLNDLIQQLRLSRSYLYDQVLDKPGGISTFKVGNRRLASARSVDAWIERQEAAAARVGNETGASAGETKALALYLHKNIISDEEIPEYRPQGFDDARLAFSERAADAPWPDMAQGEAAFGGSLAALVEWAPVAPELKNRDTEIVKNSMRFRWKAVRDQFIDVLDAPAVMAAWRAECPGAAGGEEIAAPAT